MGPIHFIEIQRNKLDFRITYLFFEVFPLFSFWSFYFFIIISTFSIRKTQSPGSKFNIPVLRSQILVRVVEQTSPCHLMPLATLRRHIEPLYNVRCDGGATVIGRRLPRQRHTLVLDILNDKEAWRRRPVSDQDTQLAGVRA